MQVRDTPTISTKEQLLSIRRPIAEDFDNLNALILNELHSNVPLIREITEHIIQSGGKRLRPLVVILWARALSYSDGIEHLELAAIIEFVHTATLLHDDVIDNSHMRRGRKTANALWGNQASVLIGDFLYSRSFQILTRRSNVPIMQVLANTTNAIAEGEVLQLMNCKDPDISEASYYDVIERKTAKLFESACEIGAMLHTQDTSVRKAAASYGMNIGMAFQIIDDLLDYSSTQTAMGKNVGDDLTEGKPTLPLIYTLQHCDSDMQVIIRHAIENADATQLDKIIDAMREVKAFEYCLSCATKHIDTANQALTILPDSPYKTSLQTLLEFSLQREF